jgi:hypothetical protein
MHRITFMAVAAAALFATAGAASAQVYYSGPGYGVHIEPRYEREYEEPRYRRRWDGEERRSYRRGWDGDERRSDRRGGDRDRQYGQRRMNPSGNGCLENYTVQDGVCKPYTGR